MNINSKNSFNVIVDVEALSLRYTRKIDNKLYSIQKHCDDALSLLNTMSHLSTMHDDTFKLACSISKSIEDSSDGDK